MIVNASENGWNIIFQRAHAQLAGQLAMQWKVSQRPERWTETLAAIIDHDDGQKDWREGAHLTEAGAPMDFTLQELDLQQARHVVDNARYRSRWIALLTSMHTSALYEKLRGTNSETDDFLDEQKAYQSKLRHSLKINKEIAEAAYHIMFICDACSLVLAKNEVPAGGRKLELGKDPDGKSCFIFEKQGNCYSIDPWPFESNQFQVFIEIFQINQLAFKSDSELYEAFDQAETIEKKWNFSQ